MEPTMAASPARPPARTLTPEQFLELYPRIAGAEDPPKEDPPKADPPKQDPPKEDPPKADPPKQDPPKEESPAEKRAREAEARAEAAEAKVKEHEDAKKTELELAQDREATAKAEAATAKAELLRMTVAGEKKIPTELAASLSGSTREELEASADVFLKHVKPTGGAQLPVAGFDGGVGASPPAGSLDQQIQEATAKQDWSAVHRLNAQKLAGVMSAPTSTKET